jgi:hypothetical protein
MIIWHQLDIPDTPVLPATGAAASVFPHPFSSTTRFDRG